MKWFLIKAECPHNILEAMVGHTNIYEAADFAVTKLKEMLCSDTKLEEVSEATEEELENRLISGRPEKNQFYFTNQSLKE